MAWQELLDGPRQGLPLASSISEGEGGNLQPEHDEYLTRMWGLIKIMGPFGV